MRAPNTAILLALLNIFNLSFAFGDEFYDAIKAGKKYDAKTVKELRKNTLEKARVDEVNAITKDNPNFTPLTGQVTPKLSDAELKRMRDEDALLPAETPDPSLKPHEIKADQINVKTGENLTNPKADVQPTVAPIRPNGPGPGGPPASAISSRPDQPSPPVKVTNDDPDFVIFPAETKSTPKLKGTPIPTFKK